MPLQQGQPYGGSSETGGASCGLEQDGFSISVPLQKHKPRVGREIRGTQAHMLGVRVRPLEASGRQKASEDCLKRAHPARCWEASQRLGRAP
jgi:hypothetical protein